MAGRPTKYKPEYCEQAIDYLAEGKSITQLSAFLRVHKDTLYQWAKDYETFSDALTRGKELSQAYWEGELVKMMREREVNAPLVKLYFANRFGWSDNQKVESDNKHELVITRRTINSKDDIKT